MNRRLLWGAAALAAVGAAAAWLWFHRDTARINRTLDRVVAETRKQGPEGAIPAAARAHSIADAFTEEPRLELEEWHYSPAGRSDLASAIFRVRASLARLAIRIYDRSLTFSTGRDQATMRLTARATAEEGVGGPERDTRELELHWVRTSEGWRIASVQNVSVIRRIPGSPDPRTERPRPQSF